MKARSARGGEQDRSRDDELASIGQNRERKRETESEKREEKRTD